ncbi:MAG: arginine--tRNA ligase [Anaerorhabdus sp.]
MNKIENILVEGIKNTIFKLYGLNQDELVMIEIPKDNKNGDYSSNIAMRLTKILKKAPKVIAEEIVSDICKCVKEIKKVEIAGPGFINFWMNTELLTDIINVILDAKDEYGTNNSGNKEKVLVEYVSANPTGNLHLGHARGAAWGDSVCRLYKKSGYECLREYYVNDAGMQIENLGLSLYARYAQIFNQTQELPEDGYFGDDIKKIAAKIADEKGDYWINNSEGRLEFFKKEGIKKELEKIKNDLILFRCEFDSWVSEQSLYDENRVSDTILKMKEKGVTYYKDDALWFKSTLYNDDKDRVLIKSDGSLTYLTPDIANHLYKLERGYDKLVNFWGADHHGYIPRMKSAIQAMGYSADALEVDIIQMVRLVEGKKEVKMSKRTGNAITVRELCEDIGVDAARYFFLQRAVDTHFDFDLSLARKQTNENPVFYVQYAHARICSILNNAPEFKKQSTYDLLTHSKEVDLLKYLGEFTNVIIDASKTRMPSKICVYCQKLAAYFHSFYGSLKVIDNNNLELTNQRVALLLATKQTLSISLDLLGIDAPEKM